MRLLNMKVGARLALGFGVVLALMFGLAAVTLVKLAAIGSNTEVILTEEWVKADAAHQLNTLVRGNAARTLELFVAADPAQRARIKASIAQNRQEVTALLEGLQAKVRRPEGKALLEKIVETRTRYVASFTRVAAELDAGRLYEAQQVVNGETLPALEELRTHVGALLALQKQLVDERGATIEAQIQLTRLLIVACTLGALVFGVLCALWLTRTITRPLAAAVAVAEKVADGDLTSRIEPRGRDELAALMTALQRMNEGLQKIIGTVRDGTGAIASASQEIATGNADLSSRTEQQASSLEETASSMEELTSTVKQNADNARQANQLAASASAVAVKGGEVVGQVVGTMTSINESSKKIVDIIAVIDGIAFQTNILALNAAVEAARAGEQGRGFAVVASEVRSLAQRSAAAAKEIKQLITDSVGKVADGTRLVDEAGRTMGDIVASVQRVTDIMAEISAASQEQSSGIEQVNQAVTQMDEATQQNAALVEQAAAAAESLQEQAARLTEAIGIFRISHLAVANEDAPARPPRPASDGKVAALPVRPVVRERKPAAPASGRRSAAAGTDDVWEEF